MFVKCHNKFHWLFSLWHHTNQINLPLTKVCCYFPRLNLIKTKIVFFFMFFMFSITRKYFLCFYYFVHLLKHMIFPFHSTVISFIRWNYACACLTVLLNGSIILFIFFLLSRLLSFSCFIFKFIYLFYIFLFILLGVINAL